MSFDRAFHERILGGPMTEIGHDVAIRMVGEGAERKLYWEHRCKLDLSASVALGHIVFRQDGHANGWDLVSEEPLTVGGSLLCGSCGRHGFVTAGTWVPA